MNKFLFVVCMFLPSCIGTKHVVPAHPLPDKYEYQNNAYNTPEELAAWWQLFDDEALNQLVDKAVAQNYSLAIAVEKIMQSRALYERKKADLFPELDVVSQVNRTRFSTALAQNSFLQNNNNTESFFRLGFDGIWEIDFWGKIWREQKARFYEFQAQIEQMHDVYIILLADVARTYIDICAFNSVYNFLEQQIVLHTKLLELQQDLYDAGLSSKIQVAIREQQLAANKEQREQIILNLKQSKNQLAVLLGENPESVSLPMRSTVPLSTTRLAIGMPSDLLRRRPDIRRQERELAAANQRVGQAIAEWFPSFSLLGGIVSDSNKADDWFTSKSLSWSIGPSIRWPLINFGRIKATIRARESSKRQAALAYTQVVITALQEVEDFLVGYFQNQEQKDITAYKLEQSLVEQELEKIKFESGLASEIAYLEAAIQSIANQIEYTTIQRSLSTNLVSLYKALGGGW